MRTLPIAAAALLLLAPPLALAAHETVVVRTYEVGAVNLRVSVPDPTNGVLADCALAPDCSVDVGGVVVAIPLGSTVAGVAIADAHSARVRGLACQTTDGDTTCGEPGEPAVQFCDSFADVISTNGVPFVAGLELSVFAFATPARVSIGNPASSGVVLCPDGSPNFATQGTVAVTLAP